MTRATGILGLAAVICTLATALRADPPVLKQEPPTGTLAFGRTVLVDDGTCPAGMIKQVTGGANVDARGNVNPAAPRCQTSCVPRK